jgi:hypothetical protein
MDVGNPIAPTRDEDPGRWLVRGKQCFSYFKALDGKADITGGDENQELLQQARNENAKIDNKVKFMDWISISVSLLRIKL